MVHGTAMHHIFLVLSVPVSGHHRVWPGKKKHRNISSLSTLADFQKWGIEVLLRPDCWPIQIWRNGIDACLELLIRSSFKDEIRDSTLLSIHYKALHTLWLPKQGGQPFAKLWRQIVIFNSAWKLELLNSRSIPTLSFWNELIMHQKTVNRFCVNVNMHEGFSSLEGSRLLKRGQLDTDQGAGSHDPTALKWTKWWVVLGVTFEEYHGLKRYTWRVDTQRVGAVVTNNVVEHTVCSRTSGAMSR